MKRPATFACVRAASFAAAGAAPRGAGFAMRFADSKAASTWYTPAAMAVPACQPGRI